MSGLPMQAFFDRLIYISRNGDDLAHARAVAEQAMEMLRLLPLIFVSTSQVKRPAMSRSIRLSGHTSRAESVCCAMAQGVRWPKRLKRLAASARRNNW
jgi:hypothetical protein